MNIDGKALKKAEALYEKKKREHELEKARRLDAVSQRYPRIEEINGELKRLGLRIVEAYFEGSDIDERINGIRRQSNRLLAERRRLLESNGYPEDYLDDKSFCPKCGDTGYVGSQMCACLLDLYRKEQENGLSELFGLSSGQLDNVLNEYSSGVDKENGINSISLIKKIINEIKCFSEKMGDISQNLYLRGVGSSNEIIFLSYIARAAIQKGLFTIYTPAFSFFRTLEDERFGKDIIAAEEADRYYKCDLLIIGELGTEQTTSYAAAVMFNIITKRYAEKKTTVISSALNSDDMAMRYNLQTAYRIKEYYKQLYIPEKN